MENNEEQKVVEEIKEESAPIQKESVKKSGLYTAGLVCSIVGLCLFWSVWIGLVCGVLGIIFGAITYSKVNNKTPIILGSVATFLALIMMIVYPIIVKNVFNKAVDEFKDGFNEALKETEDADGKNILDQLEENVQSAIEEGKEQAKKADETLDNAKEKVQEGYDKAKDELEKTSDLENKANDIINDIIN